ncbi:hypothetical protein GDO86_016532 [Hymenochirus boettgeri]|nr:hypothetical protein GDO86_016532 [Hymenochirus boettgeri]
MTGVRFFICAFRNVELCFRLCPKPPLDYKSCLTLNRRFSYHIGHCRTSLPGFSHKISPGFLLASRNSWTSTLRLKSKKSHQKGTEGLSDNEEEERDPEDISDYEDETEDPNVRKDYKDLEKAVQSFRYDVILTAGLDISRNKVEDAFYKSSLRLNGEKLWKKSRAVKVGDTLDLILEQDKESETTTVMRVVLKNVAEDKTSTEKYKVLLRRWKNLKIQKPDSNH